MSEEGEAKSSQRCRGEVVVLYQDRAGRRRGEGCTKERLSPDELDGLRGEKGAWNRWTKNLLVERRPVVPTVLRTARHGRAKCGPR